MGRLKQALPEDFSVLDDDRLWVDPTERLGGLIDDSDIYTGLATAIANHSHPMTPPDRRRYSGEHVERTTRKYTAIDDDHDCGIGLDDGCNHKSHKEQDDGIS